MLRISARLRAGRGLGAKDNGYSVRIGPPKAGRAGRCSASVLADEPVSFSISPFVVLVQLRGACASDKE